MRIQRLCATGAIILTAALSGCASNQTVPANDSWEGVNRAIYGFNNVADTIIVKPLAKGYRFVTPDPVEQGVSNVFSNLAYPTVAVNNLLQGKPGDAARDAARFVLNSTLGIAGIFDVAKRAGLEKNNEDFGQTLAVWGVPSGPYVMLPFLGPSTLRDAVSLPLDQALHVRNYIDESGTRDKLLVLQIISLRARLLAFDEQIQASNDPYIFIREAYLQNRNFSIYDGAPPETVDEFDIDDDFDADLEDFESEL
ncbi:MAG: VacJ family lipoprotein [Pseudomonadota bacterium]